MQTGRHYYISDDDITRVTKFSDEIIVQPILLGSNLVPVLILVLGYPPARMMIIVLLNL